VIDVRKDESDKEMKTKRSRKIWDCILLFYMVLTIDADS